MKCWGTGESWYYHKVAKGQEEKWEIRKKQIINQNKKYNACIWSILSTWKNKIEMQNWWTFKWSIQSRKESIFVTRQYIVKTLEKVGNSEDTNFINMKIFSYI